MPVERSDAQGNPSLTKGLWGGYLDSVPVGVKPREHENPASSFGRQRFFYAAVRELSNTDWLFAKYWQPGSPMDVVMSEFSFALDESRRMGQITEVEEKKLKADYETRAIAFFCMEGLISTVQHCDGTLSKVVERMPAEEVMKKYGWDKDKSTLVSHDPAIAYPLKWIKDHGESGALLRYFKQGREAEYKLTLTNLLRVDPQWVIYRGIHKLPDGIEESVIHIALDYWQLEILPDLHRHLYAEYMATGKVNLTDSVPMNKKGDPLKTIKDFVKPDDPKLDVLSYDDVYWSNIDRPVDVIEKVKGVYKNDEEILPCLRDFLTYQDREFPRDPEHPDKIQGLQGRIPSDFTIKDINRYVKMQDAFIGGPQAAMLADFSKFAEGLDALCNLYATIPNRSDILGWMVGEIFYIKVRALMINTDREGFADQIFKIMNLGQEDTPRELENVKGGILGSGGRGAFGAVARAVGAYDLHIGTQHYTDALAMIHTGIKNTGLAKTAQPVLAVLASLNRLAVGGKRR